MDCYCDLPIMAQIHDIMGAALHSQLIPAAICAFVMLACVMGLLVAGASQFGAAGCGGGAAADCGRTGPITASEGGYGKGYVEAAANGSSRDGYRGSSDQRVVA
jgi:hypothetical protein